jgi:hypothetical protein
MRNVAIRLTERQANGLEKGFKSLHAYARSAIDSWQAIRTTAIKSLRRKNWTDAQREALRRLRPPRGAGRSVLMTLASDDKTLHSKLLMLSEYEAVVLATLIRNKQTRLLA